MGIHIYIWWVDLDFFFRGVLHCVADRHMAGFSFAFFASFLSVAHVAGFTHLLSFPLLTAHRLPSSVISTSIFLSRYIHIGWIEYPERNHIALSFPSLFHPLANSLSYPSLHRSYC